MSGRKLRSGTLTFPEKAPSQVGVSSRESKVRARDATRDKENENPNVARGASPARPKSKEPILKTPDKPMVRVFYGNAAAEVKAIDDDLNVALGIEEEEKVTVLDEDEEFIGKKAKAIAEDKESKTKKDLDETEDLSKRVAKKRKVKKLMPKKVETEVIAVDESEDLPIEKHTTEVPKDERSKKRTTGKKRKRGKSKLERDGAWSKSSEKIQRKRARTDGDAQAFLRSKRRVPAPKKGEKNTVLYDSRITKWLSPDSRKLFNCRFLLNAQRNNPHFTPVREVTKYSINGTPREVRSRSGRTFYLARNSKSIRFYDENKPVGSPHPVLKAVDVAEAKKINASITFKLVKPAEDEIKGYEYLITPELVAKSARQIKANNGRRSKSQNAVMAKRPKDAKEASANKYMQLFNLKDKLPVDVKEKLAAEWLHYIMHQLLANAAQQAKNMGCGTFHANTDMLNMEFQHPLLIKAYPKGYRVKVVPHYVEGVEKNKMLTNLEYTISTEHFTLEFVFNCQTTIVPKLTDHTYMRALFIAAIGLKDKSIEDLEGVDLNQPLPVLSYTPAAPPARPIAKERPSIASPAKEPAAKSKKPGCR